ncbi:sigma-70 family RNA polymerase sigma factor [Pelagicoccus sp. SDUM812003]|uniref:RNA polymerase sigma factor n=1 Tax=Pelagicoccus sp. SDUM812003 TaxID=3041267 RepID=UPI00280D6EFA|nr:sigma-70 family RNA polymerase sigma factor [Pelagicoccus sp. SDUM812003]MDQ8202241.1 sigma-70 family RNA polymerase sigma factor [Pelagicoccus sp. SDUM812003]
MTEDSELLRRYREDGSRDAFAEIVNRHIDLVYSVASRQLGEFAHLAGDVCQLVFLNLARKAQHLKPQVVLSGWLYRSVLLAAKDARRKEIRRRQRERTAMFQEEAIERPHENWEQARPLIDAAICDLSQSDQAAIALRFFDEKSHAEIGQRLGISEDAARMRVKRALEKLHHHLARKGIKSSGAALGLVIAGQASMAAPSGLSAAIVQHSLTELCVASSASTVNAVINFMNTTKAASVSLSIASVIAAGTLVYFSSQFAAANENLSHARLEFDRYQNLLAEARSLRAELAQAGEREISPVSPASPPLSIHGFTEEEFEVELEAWVERADHLAEYVARNQRYHIPELDDADVALWMDSVKEGPLQTEADYRKALSRLREMAKQESTKQLTIAVRSYLEDHDNRLPRSIAELAAVTDLELDPAILARYHIDRSVGERATDSDSRNPILKEEPVDPIWEAVISIYPRGMMNHYSVGFSLDGAYYRFEKEHGRAPHNDQEIAPYLPDSASQETIAEYNAARSTPIAFDSNTMSADK